MILTRSVICSVCGAKSGEDCFALENDKKVSTPTYHFLRVLSAVSEQAKEWVKKVAEKNRLIEKEEQEKFEKAKLQSKEEKLPEKYGPYAKDDPRTHRGW
jgi:cell shape-determining protein MreC